MKKILSILILLTIISCETSEKKNMVQSWHGSMRGLSQSITKALPTLMSESSRVNRFQKAKMDTALNDLKGYSENLTNKKMVIPSNDPSLRYIAKDFKSKLNDISKMTDHGDYKATRSALRDLTKYCIACHTRTQTSSAYFSQDFEAETKEMSDIEKAQFYTAIRQFEKALIHYEKALTNPRWAKKHKDEWNEGVVEMLAITVEVKNNANLALELISRLFDSKSYPRDLDKAARMWRVDAKNWNKLGESKARFEGITDLLDKARTREKSLTHSGLILRLRAMAKLNAYLKEGGFQSRGEQAVLYYTGLVADSLSEFNFKAFPSSYFRACVELDPKSVTGLKCKKML